MAKLFENDLFIKIISVLLAFILWLYVMGEQNPQMTQTINNVPVELEGLDTSKLMLMEDSNKLFVNVKVRGRRSAVSQVAIKDIYASAELRGRMDGENRIPVNVKVPDTVELVEVTPKEVTVHLDAVVEKQVPVKVVTQGLAAEGYIASETQVRPKDVVLKGARTILNSVDTALVSVDLNNSSDTIIASFPVRAVDESGKEIKDISYRPDIVEVTVPIIPYKSVTVEPRLSEGPPSGFIITEIVIDPTKVSITGTESRLRDLMSISTEEIDISDATATKQVDVNLVLPQGITLVNRNDSEVSVTVNIEEEVIRRLEFEASVSVIEIADELEAVVEPMEFILEYASIQPKNQLLHIDDVALTVDASGITEPGVYTLEVKAEIPNAYRLISLQPNTVQIEFTSI
jgi:YbbR domain-containing protein